MNSVTLEKLVGQLLELGFEVSEEDRERLFQIREKVDGEICRICHVRYVPKETLLWEADRICGLFLQEKKRRGDLALFENGAAVQSVSEGDVNVHFFKSDSDSDRLDKLIEELLGCKEDLLCYRRLKW